MRTRVLSNQLRRLEARLPLRPTKSDEEQYRLTLEERCSGLCYLRRRMEPWSALPADLVQTIAEFEEARQQAAVPEALTLRTWEVLTGLPPPLS